MITVLVKKQNNSIVQVTLEGHANYAEVNYDIVCASISTLVQTAAMGLKEIAKVDFQYKVDEKIPYLKILLNKELGKKQRHDCDIILETMILGIKDIESGFAKFVKLEVV